MKTRRRVFARCIIFREVTAALNDSTPLYSTPRRADEARWRGRGQGGGG